MAVAIGFAVVSSLLLLRILALLRHAWRTLPPGAPFPMAILVVSEHFGFDAAVRAASGHSTFV